MIFIRNTQDIPEFIKHRIICIDILQECLISGKNVFFFSVVYLYEYYYIIILYMYITT